MAKILYSLAQDGRGHASRGYEIIRRLSKKNHKVMVLTGGDTYEPLEQVLRKMRNVSLHKLPGLKCVYNKNGKINYVKTVSRNIPSLICGEMIIKKLKNLIEKYQFDFAISDFEPFLPRAAKSKKLGFITIDNQHKIVWGKLRKRSLLPKHISSYLVTRSIIHSVYPLGTKCIISSVFKPELRKRIIKRRNIIVVGPIIRKEVEELKNRVTKKDFVLVYVKPVLEKAIIPVLKKINQKFVMYVATPEKYKKQGHIKYKKHSATKFAGDLAKCKAVVSSAGEQLISEALYLGKPVFLMPEGGTFEQTLNSYSVREAGVGDFKEITRVRKEHVSAFLKNLDSYEENIKKLKIKNSINQVMKIIYSELKK